MSLVSKVIVTGAAGQDGLILSNKLSKLGVEVLGVVRNEQQAEIFQKYIPEASVKNFDSSDSGKIQSLLKDFKPNQIYHLSSKSSVANSWVESEATLVTNVFQTLNWLNCLKELKMQDTRFYQASSSEMFGLPPESPQTESTVLHPRSPYGVSKVAAHHLVVNYRESFGQFASTGILFNHESPLRTPSFVTRKITKGVAEIAHNISSKITLGNLDISRDWGWAPDYVDGMISILNHVTPDDFILATGVSHTLREFISTAFARIGISDWSDYVDVDQSLLRPADVFNVVGNNQKARDKLNWQPRMKFESIVWEMVDFDLALIENPSKSPYWKFP